MLAASFSQALASLCACTVVLSDVLWQVFNKHTYVNLRDSCQLWISQHSAFKCCSKYCFTHSQNHSKWIGSCLPCRCGTMGVYLLLTSKQLQIEDSWPLDRKQYFKCYRCPWAGQAQRWWDEQPSTKELHTASFWLETFVLSPASSITGFGCNTPDSDAYSVEYQI